VRHSQPPAARDADASVTPTHSASVTPMMSASAKRYWRRLSLIYPSYPRRSTLRGPDGSKINSGICCALPRRRVLSLLAGDGKEIVVDTVARMSSKGQVTVPKAVRQALGVGEGDEIVFRVEGNRAILARTSDFLSLAGSVAVPAAKRNASWDEVIRHTRAARASRAR
jgi:AbrB family looped-hinge helix DNA binding protein